MMSWGYGELPWRRAKAAAPAEKIYRSKLTGEYFVLMSIGVLFTAIAFWQGFAVGRVISSRGYPFFVVAGLFLIILMYATFISLGRKITITPLFIVYEDRIGKFNVSWRDLKILGRPHPQKKHFRTVTLSDGHRSFYLDSMSYKDFKVIMSHIDAAKKGSKESTGYTI
jgi:hypothetical protein